MRAGPPHFPFRFTHHAVSMHVVQGSPSVIFRPEGNLHLKAVSYSSPQVQASLCDAMHDLYVISSRPGHGGRRKFIPGHVRTAKKCKLKKLPSTRQWAL